MKYPEHPMRFISILFGIFFPLYSSAQTEQVKEYSVDVNHSVRVICENGRLALYLFDRNKEVFATYLDACSAYIIYDDAIELDKKAIYFIQKEPEASYFSKNVYIIDIPTNSINFVGTIPLNENIRHYKLIPNKESNNNESNDNEEMPVFTIDENYSVLTHCIDHKLSFLLKKNGDNIYSINTMDSCENKINYETAMLGKPIIWVSPVEPPWLPGNSSSLYTVETNTGKIKFSGMLPTAADFQDGSFVFEHIDYSAKYKNIYVYKSGRIISKSTYLVFDGKICIKERNGIAYADFYCKEGIVATKKSPVCVASNFGQRPKIIPLRQCDIKKSEING